MIECKIESIRVSMVTQHRVVILKEVDSERYLPIWIGHFEADAIAIPMQNVPVQRPLTHDLLKGCIEQLGGKLTQVVINELADETFFAKLIVDAGGRHVEVDARPSDALALAVRSGVPIFAADAVLEQAALGGDAGIVDDEGEEGSTLEATGEQVVDPRLDVFRDFVNSLDVDAEGESRSS